jgi:DNA polymerase-3 subunit beta
MKINVSKKEFLKSWGLAERLAGGNGTLNIFSTVFMDADFERTELRSTSIRTAVICKTGGVTVIEPGQAAIPVKRVSELFNKAGAEEFAVEIKEGNATMTAGRSKYRFTTYPAGDFPRLPASASASPFFEAKAGELAKGLERGMLSASHRDEMPQYISSVYFDVENGTLSLVSTDKSRLALSRIECGSVGETAAMLPCSGIKELQKILGTVDANAEVRVALDDAQAYFAVQDIEFSVRRVESKFPPYKKHLPKAACTAVSVERTAFLAALDRIKVVVGDTNRTVVLAFEKSDECVLSGFSNEFGEAVEIVPCSFSGEPARAGFVVNFLMEPVNLISTANVRLSFESPDGHLQVRNEGTDDFFCLVAPVDLKKGNDSAAVRED